jgi:hypothetical protein
LLFQNNLSDLPNQIPKQPERRAMSKQTEPKTLPSTSYLKWLFMYDPETGVLRWRTAPKFRAHLLGKRAGSQNKHTRRWWVRIDGKQYAAARVIWKMKTGKDPTEMIDHINRDPSDDRWVNLREISRRDNRLNAHDSISARQRRT